MKSIIILVSVRYPNYRRVVVDATEDKELAINRKLLSLIARGVIEDYYIIHRGEVKSSKSITSYVYIVNDGIVYGCLGKFVGIEAAIEYCDLNDWTWKCYTGDRFRMIIAGKELHVC